MNRALFVALLLGVSCKPASEPAPEDTGETRGPVDELEVPDVTGVNFEAAYEEAVRLALSVNMRLAWQGHQQTLSKLTPGCPDVYLGPPPEDIVETDLDEDVPGLTWADHCTQGSGTYYNGYNYWDASLEVTGSATDGSYDGVRELLGEGSVGDATGVSFAFRGEATDATFRAYGEGFDTWRYSSVVNGSLESRDLFTGTATPKGWRTDLSTVLSRGDADRLELRGNAYFFDGRIATRFDSFNMDTMVIGSVGAGPDDCTLEPLGFIGLRDENANWYDLVFLPRYENDITDTPYPNDPLAACDGCGTLYIRGVKQDTPVCPDFSFVFDGAIQPPTAADYVSTLRTLPLEVP